MLSPIKLPTAKEQATSELRKAILSRQFSEGEIITIDGTARLLGVSATPVRDAFAELERDGLIQLRQNRGAVVLGVTEKYIRDHYGVRALLESESARLAAGADVSNIRKAFDEAEKCLEELRYGEYSRLNLAFHQQIWKASGNDRMYHILMEMWNGLSLGSTASTAEYACTSLAEHREILYALESHDSEKSAGLMHSHIERSMIDMLTHYE